MKQEIQEEKMFLQYIQNLSEEDRLQFFREGEWKLETIKQNALRLIRLEENHGN